MTVKGLITNRDENDFATIKYSYGHVIAPHVSSNNPTSEGCIFLSLSFFWSTPGLLN